MLPVGARPLAARLRGRGRGSRRTAPVVFSAPYIYLREMNIQKKTKGKKKKPCFLSKNMEMKKLHLNLALPKSSESTSLNSIIGLLD